MTPSLDLRPSLNPITPTAIREHIMTDEQLISLYFDGELDAEVEADLEARLATEPALQEALDALLEVRAGVRAVTRAEMQRLDLTGFSDRVRAALPPDHEVEWLRAPTPATPAAPSLGFGARVSAWLSANLKPLCMGAALAVAVMVTLRLLSGDALTSTSGTADPPRAPGARPQGASVHIKLDGRASQMQEEDEGEGGAGSDI
jgi:hypothetical protein